MTTGRSLRWGEAAFGGGVTALGVLIAVQTITHAGSVRAVVGPALFPFLVAGGLVLIGAALLREALAGHIAHEGGFELDGLAVVIISAGLIAQMLLLETVGWIPATTLLFMATARAFGSRRPFLDVALGLAVASLSFVAFNYGLDLNLPSGVLTDLIAPAP